VLLSVTGPRWIKNDSALSHDQSRIRSRFMCCPNSNPVSSWFRSRCFPVLIQMQILTCPDSYLILIQFCPAPAPVLISSLIYRNPSTVLILFCLNLGLVLSLSITYPNPISTQCSSRLDPIQIPSRFYSNPVRMLSETYPSPTQILSRTYPDYNQFLFRFRSDII
jgi:hypothetical protein